MERNCKTLLKDIKEELKKQEMYIIFVNERNQGLIHNFNVVSIKIQTSCS